MSSSERLREEEVDEPSVPVQPSKKAPIWDYFKASEQGSARCNHCSKTIKTQYGNTTGMRRHLENKHYSTYVLFKKHESQLEAKKTSKQSTLTSRFQSEVGSSSKQATLRDLQKWDSKHPKALQITREIGKWMAFNLHPYSLVEEEGLKKVLKAAQPMYSIPGCKTFSRTIIPDLYREVKANIMDRIEKEKVILKSLSITLDFWTSSANYPFLAITAHFMDEDFIINNICLGCYSFSGDHTKENTAQKIEECMAEWGINGVDIPIYAITDNARNVKSAVLSIPSVEALSCFAHTLQLALGDAKKETPGMLLLISKVKKLVGHYKHSSQATERLHAQQRLLGKEELNLIQDCETRWNSEYLMLSRFLLNREAISRDLADSGKLDNLTVSEWRMVEGYVSILEPLHLATKEACSSIMPTCSMVIPIIYCIGEHLKLQIKGDNTTGKMFARELLKSMQARFPNLMKVDPYFTAMLIDPRFKDVVLEPHERAQGLQDLTSKIRPLTRQNEDVELPTSLADPAQKTNTLWSVFEKAAAAKSKINTVGPSEVESEILQELRTYFGEPHIPHSHNPCIWWKENSLKFPKLATIVQQYLGIPATQVASERTFSSAGNVVTSRRERLTSCHVEE